MASYNDNPAIQRFVEYLQIPSVHPNLDYGPCITFLKKQASELELPYKIYYATPNKPIFIMTWEGTDPSLPACLLNSHMDVVPVFPESWIHPPFSAHIDEDGKIFARGSQDMKSIGMQYLEVVRRLKEKDLRLRRTLHLSYVPDEELGGVDGMEKFVLMDEFKSLNLGFSLDEGIPNPGNDYFVFYAERSIWHLIIKCPGTPGHASLLLPNTAGEKVRVVIDKFMDFRAKEKKRLDDNPNLTIGDVTSVNLTMINGGVQTNVLPESLTVVFDVRLAVDVNHDEFEKMVNDWCKEAGEGITIDYDIKNVHVEPTKLDESNPFWVAFKTAADELGLTLRPRIFPGGTDSRFVRGVGIPALGFSPMANTPLLLHDHNEYLKADIFLKGIDIYEKLISALANV